MTEDFNSIFAGLLTQAEANLDDQGVPDHFGEELALAEGESYQGRFRGEDDDRAFDPPRRVYLLQDLDGTLRFVRARAMLERRMREAEPGHGDYIALVRGQDGETKTGNALQMWGVSKRPCSNPLAETAETEPASTSEPEAVPVDDETAAEDDIPF